MTSGGHHDPNPFDDDAIGPTRVRDPLLGTKAGEYLLGETLGQGAMGIVYKATHPILGRQAAVKVLRIESPDAAQKLLGEARAVAQARHPNIIDIFGFGTTDDGQPYFVMELLEGEPLDLWLRDRSPLAPAEAVGILKQLFSGLAAAHAAQVIHRDLKPSNLFMAKLADGTHFLKILDFGLSKRVDPSAPEKTLGNVTGTPLYMAPEQTVGDPSTPATDLYAAGCLAYELLVGHPPFSAPSVEELLFHQRETPPPPLPDRLPLALRELVAGLLEKVPARRVASATEARQQLERAERKLMASTPTGALPPIPASRPATAPRVRASASRLPAAPERPTVRLAEGLLPPSGSQRAVSAPQSPEARTSSSGSQRAVSASQDRPTVRMEPLLKQSASKLPPAPPPPKPTVILSDLKLEKAPRGEKPGRPVVSAPQVADTAAELPPVREPAPQWTWLLVLLGVLLGVGVIVTLALR